MLYNGGKAKNKTNAQAPSRVGDKILGIEKVELKPDNLRNFL